MHYGPCYEPRYRTHLGIPNESARDISCNSVRDVRETPVMSTTRRLLGTGPATTRSTPPTDTAPRLLAAERVEPGALLGEVEHRDVVTPKGRRNLGPGTAVTPEGAP